jgi:hypothetical protein
MTTKVPETLTDEHLSKTYLYVNKWLKWEMCTDRIDQEAAKKAIHLAYSLCNPPIAPPKRIMFFQSPQQAVLAVQIYEYCQERKLDPKQLTAEQKGELEAHLKENSQYSTGGFGSMDAPQMAFYDFFKCEFNLHEEHKVLAGIEEIVKTCGYWWPFEEIVFVSDRPDFIGVDENNQCHCEDGPAIHYTDGYQIFVWHGFQVPDDKTWIITNPEKLTVEMIDQESNEDIKSIMIAKYGTEKYLTNIGAKILDMDSQKVNPFDKNDDTCMQRILMVDTRGRKYLIGTDGSSKIAYYMNVENTVNTCAEAHNSIALVDESSIIANS